MATGATLATSNRTINRSITRDSRNWWRDLQALQAGWGALIVTQMQRFFISKHHSHRAKRCFKLRCLRKMVTRRVLKLRFFRHPPACGRVGRGSGRGGPSPGLRARLSRKRESEISCHVFTLVVYLFRFVFPGENRTFKTHASGYQK